MIGKGRKRLLIALAFLLPNLLGFLLFTAGPVLFSLYMSFTDWALAKHNRASGLMPSFVGFENYQRVLVGDESRLFWNYFGNTLYLMIGIPIGIAGSLLLALMLNGNPGPSTRRSRIRSSTLAGIITLVTCIGAWAITTPGPTPPPGSEAAVTLSTEQGLTMMLEWEVQRARSNFAVLCVATLGFLVTCGLAFGTVFFRTVFYLPSLLAGVAMFLLWKTIYRPEGGLLNAGVGPVLSAVQATVVATPAWLWYAIGLLLVLAAAALSLRLITVGITRMVYKEAGLTPFLGRVCIVISLLATAVGIGWATVQIPERSLFPTDWKALDAADLAEIRSELLVEFPHADPASLDIIIDQLSGDPAERDDTVITGTRPLSEAELQEIRRALFGAHPRATAQILTAALARSDADASRIGEIVFERSQRVHRGYTWGHNIIVDGATLAGLKPPAWLQDARWAKPALVIMGVWLVVGGANMLLYLAGLSNIPPELYEAAAIDGATGWQRFIHVTWPQLAPTTFFIVIMATIGGLQGGFEQVMIMTAGKYDTVVLAFYQYQVAFEDRFELGLASAIAWVMCAMIFVMTAINFRVGSQMTNE